MRANQPAADMIGNLGGRGFGEFERLLAVGLHPEPIERVADQFNPMGLAASAFQADAESCWQSWHRTPVYWREREGEIDPMLAVSIGVGV